MKQIWNVPTIFLRGYAIEWEKPVLIYSECVIYITNFLFYRGSFINPSRVFAEISPFNNTASRCPGDWPNLPRHWGRLSHFGLAPFFYFIQKTAHARGLFWRYYLFSNEYRIFSRLPFVHNIFYMGTGSFCVFLTQPAPVYIYFHWSPNAYMDMFVASNHFFFKTVL